MTPKRTRADAEQTRKQLLQAGRVLFGSVGFGATKATDIAELAGVTRGALLHHFIDKEGLFAAVLEAVEEEVATQVIFGASAGSDPLELLELGFDAFLGECVKPDVTQIMLIDGPSVLGWETWHQIDSRYGYQPILDLIRAAAAAGQVAPEDPESLSYLLLGALAEAGTIIGQSEDRGATRARMSKSLSRLIHGLRIGPIDATGA
jgi:AcrR family transcriptional regulator